MGGVGGGVEAVAQYSEAMTPEPRGMGQPLRRGKTWPDDPFHTKNKHGPSCKMKTGNSGPHSIASKFPLLRKSGPLDVLSVGPTVRTENSIHSIWQPGGLPLPFGEIACHSGPIPRGGVIPG